jgi:uncharacterized LabA/DUF88 family protein
VFVDYQNAYMQARRCFGGATAPASTGQIDPGRLGGLIAARPAHERTSRRLHQVRVYRGIPQAERDRRAFTAADRQIGEWCRDPRVEVITRPLRYPRGGSGDRPQEKGIDVRLAVDFVAMALRGEYDVGVLLSHDTDLVPALEGVLDLSPATRVEVAAWAPTNGRVNRLRVPGRQLWCHYLTAADYTAVADSRSYAHP